MEDKVTKSGLFKYMAIPCQDYRGATDCKEPATVMVAILRHGRPEGLEWDQHMLLCEWHAGQDQTRRDHGLD